MCILQRLSFLLLVLSVSAQQYGGRKAKEGEFPYVVAISGSFKVAGTLISLDKILTSAHRIANEWRRAGKLTAVAGVVIISDKKDEHSQVRNVIYYKPYFDYHWERPYGVLHDIALAGVDKPFLISASVNVAPFISGEADVFKTAWDELAKNKTACQVVTWVCTKDSSFNGNSENDVTLQVLNATPQEDDDCITSLNEMYTPDFICASSVDLYHQIIRLKITSGVMICNGNVYAIYYLFHSSKDSVHMLLRLWRYLDYFNLGAKSSSNSLQHFYPFHLFIFIVYNFSQKP